MSEPKADAVIIKQNALALPKPLVDLNLMKIVLKFFGDTFRDQGSVT